MDAAHRDNSEHRAAQAFGRVEDMTDSAQA